MTGRLFYAAAAAFAVGIFLRSVAVVPPVAIYALLFGAFLCALLWQYGRRSSLRTLLLSVALLCIALGTLRAEVASWDDRDAQFAAHLNEEVVLEGYVARAPDERAHTTHLYVEVEQLDGAAVSELVLLYADRYPTYTYGDRLRVRGTLELPEAFDTEFGRTFDYPGYLRARGVTYVISFPEIEQVGDGAGHTPLRLLFAGKRTFMEALESVLPEPSAGLAEGLLLGEKRALGEGLERAFRVAGVIHIVVLSGYNVTIVAEAVMRLLSFLLGPRGRAVVGVVAITLFALASGLSSAAVRASLMAGLVILARATGRTYDILRALVAAGVLMLLVNPALLAFDPGFQLSFLATLGLVLLAPLIEARFSLVPTRLQIREFLTATIATQIFVLPLLLYAIGELSLVSLLANALILPAVPLAMLLAFLAGTLALVSVPLALPVAYAAYGALHYVIVLAERLAALPYAAVPVPPIPFWAVVLAYALLGLLLYRVYQKSPIQSFLPRNG